MVMNLEIPNGAGWLKRRAVRCSATLLFAIAASPHLTPNAFAELQALDRIVAIVNEDVVMASELEEQVTALSSQLRRSQGQPPPRDVMVPQVLDKLIQDRLQLEIGKRAGVQISDTELNQAMVNTAQQNGVTLEQFVARASEDGLSLSKLRQQFRQEMIVARVQQAMVSRRIEITEQEIDNFLKSEEGKFISSPDVNVGHILLRLPASDDETGTTQVIQKAEEIRTAVAGGADFRQLALIHSSGPNALKGGDLGWRKAAQLPGLFAQTLDTMTPGEVSPPLRSDAGIHLLILYERRGGGGEQLVEQSEVRHILIKPNEIRGDEDARLLVAGFRQKIIDGESFADLARLQSEDTGSALKGGELGWSMPGQFVPEFEDTIKTLEVGVISEPVRTQYGWHIIEVTARRNQDFSAEILRTQATNQIRQRKFAEELQVWLDEIRDEAFIEIKS